MGYQYDYGNNVYTLAIVVTTPSTTVCANTFNCISKLHTIPSNKYFAIIIFKLNNI